jgi:hypothetical protein
MVSCSLSTFVEVSLDKKFIFIPGRPVATLQRRVLASA